MHEVIDGVAPFGHAAKVGPKVEVREVRVPKRPEPTDWSNAG